MNRENPQLSDFFNIEVTLSDPDIDVEELHDKVITCKHSFKHKIVKLKFNIYEKGLTLDAINYMSKHGIIQLLLIPLKSQHPNDDQGYVISYVDGEVISDSGKHELDTTEVLKHIVVLRFKSVRILRHDKPYEETGDEYDEIHKSGFERRILLRK